MKSNGILPTGNVSLRRWGLVSCALALTLAACGSGTPADSASAADSPNTVDVETQAAESEASSEPAETEEEVSLRIGMGPYTASLPVFVAEDQGYFAAHNISATVSEVQSLALVPNQLGQQFDIGQSVQPIAIHAVAEGLPLVVVGGGEIVQEANKSIAGVVVRKDAGIKEADDLVGRTVAVLSAAGSNAYALQYWLQGNGVDSSEVELEVVAPPNMLAQLMSGAVDAIYLVAPFTAQALKDESLELLVNPGFEIGAESPRTGILIANREWASQNESAVIQFQRAIADAVAFIEANPAEAWSILSERTGQPVPDDPSSLSPFEALESKGDLQAWVDIMESVVPAFSLGQPVDSMLFQPIEKQGYSPSP